MVESNKTKTLFLGLTHIGQVYSSAWTKKIGPCGRYDFNKTALDHFKKKNLLKKSQT